MKPHIIVVEDSESARDALCILLEISGYRVTAAEGLHDAAQVIEQADLILLDLTLRDGNGLSLISTLQKAGTQPRHIIALTGHDDSETRKNCLNAGCSDVWIKPVPSRDLIARINGLLENTSQRAT